MGPPKIKIRPPNIVLNNLVQYNFKLSKKIGPHLAQLANPRTLIKQNKFSFKLKPFSAQPNPKSEIPNTNQTKQTHLHASTSLLEFPVFTSHLYTLPDYLSPHCLLTLIDTLTWRVIHRNIYKGVEVQEVKMMKWNAKSFVCMCERGKDSKH